MDGRNRVMMRLEVDEGWTVREIAELFGLSTTTVRHGIAYARFNWRRENSLANWMRRMGLKCVPCSLCGRMHGRRASRKKVSARDLGHGVWDGPRRGA